MLSLAIQYLNGWAMATDPADRNRAEWPPHPDRVFMALASAHFETDGDMVEREALTWLERQRAPGLWASEATDRRVTTTYVPVNDVAVPRLRSGRTPTPAQVADGVRLASGTSRAPTAPVPGGHPPRSHGVPGLGRRPSR